MKKIGVVLSGGGVRGFAHLGLLKYLDELGVKIHALSGVSAGAIVGALYASGMSPEDILAAMKKNKYFSFSDFSIRKEGLFSMQPLLKALQKLIPEDSFEKLKIKLFITATDFTNNTSVIFSKGKLFNAVIASASVPVLFEPLKMDNKFFVDGGLLNNFPVEPLVEECDFIIGSHVNKITKSGTNTAALSKMRILETCFHMAIAETVYPKTDKCDLFIEPDLHPFSMFDTAAADKIFKAGYETAVKYKEQLVKIVD